jgi:Uma2 family endonuclease
MSTDIRQATTDDPNLKKDPFFYGFRHGRRVDEQGREHLTWIPLTKEDVLFPQEGDHIMQNEQHDGDCAYLKNVFKTRVKDDPSALVLSDTGVLWDFLDRATCPDAIVFRGVRERPRTAIYDASADGSRAVLVVEITSESTRENDFGRKYQIYHQARVPLYVIADTDYSVEPRGITLIANRWTKKGYKEVPLDIDGRIELKELGLLLGIREGLLACYDSETGKLIEDYEGQLDARQKAEARAAEAEAKARQQAEARAALEAKVRELEKQIRGPQGSS